MDTRELNKKYKIILIGRIYKSRNYGNVRIVSYKNSRNVIVEFLNTGNQCAFDMKSIRKGWIRDISSPRERYKMVWGVGIIGNGQYTPSCNKNAYNVWSDMLRRCYSKKHQAKYPSYYNICSVCDEWINFQNFADWYYHQANNQEWQIDKDIITKGNKIYSPNHCAFVPSEINLLFLKGKLNKNKDTPLGVKYNPQNNKNRFLARCKDEEGRSKHLGCFSTSEEAFFVYKKYKEQRIKNLAEKYKDRLDQRVYNAMMEYQVEITD